MSALRMTSALVIVIICGALVRRKVPIPHLSRFALATRGVMLTLRWLPRLGIERSRAMRHAMTLICSVLCTFIGRRNHLLSSHRVGSFLNLICGVHHMIWQLLNALYARLELKLLEGLDSQPTVQNFHVHWSIGLGACYTRGI